MKSRSREGGMDRNWPYLLLFLFIWLVVYAFEGYAVGWLFAYNDTKLLFYGTTWFSLVKILFLILEVTPLGRPWFWLTEAPIILLIILAFERSPKAIDLVTIAVGTVLLYAASWTRQNRT